MSKANTMVKPDKLATVATSGEDGFIVFETFKDGTPVCQLASESLPASVFFRAASMRELLNKKPVIVRKGSVANTEKGYKAKPEIAACYDDDEDGKRGCKDYLMIIFGPDGGAPIDAADTETRQYDVRVERGDFEAMLKAIELTANNAKTVRELSKKKAEAPRPVKASLFKRNTAAK